MDKEISKIILDGEEYSISEDRKHITGPKKKYTQEDFKEEMGKKIPFLIAPRESAKDGIIYGFSNEEKMEKWLKEKNKFEEYEREKELDKKLKRERSPEEREKIKQYQIKFVEKDTKNFKKLLEKHNLKPEQIDELEKLSEDYDPHFKQKPRSLYLYGRVWYGGPYIKLRGGHQYCGKRYKIAYPDLGYFGFDNKASSAKLNCGSYARLYTDKWYGGASLKIEWNWVDLNFWVWAFGNSVSSAKVW